MKTCFKCKIEKPLTEFYGHPQIDDRHSLKCKACTRRDVADRVKRLKATSPEWVMAERERCRKKQQNARINGTASPLSKESRQRWLDKNPQKRQAQIAAGNALRDGKIEKKTRCEGCGKQSEDLHMHHPDYTQPLFVKFLCPPCHGKEHRKPIPFL